MNQKVNKKVSRFSLQNMLSCLELRDHPSAGPHLRLMNLAGLWHPRPERNLKINPLKQVVYYIVMFLFFSQYIRCIIRLDINALLYILATAPVHMGTVKCIFFRKDYNDWETLIDYMSITERKQLSDKDVDVHTIMNNYIQRNRTIIYLFWFMVLLCNISIFSDPYQKNVTVENGTDIYVKIFDFYVPFIDQDIPPGYYYSMGIQTVAGNVMTAYIISWDSLIMTMLMFFACQLRISRVYCTKVVDPQNKPLTHRNIIKCHNFHITLIKHQELFARLISSVMFIYLIVISINLGSCLIQISSSLDDLRGLMGSLLFIFGCLMQLLGFYWFSDQVTLESQSVSYGIFESDWVTMDAEIQKELALLQYTMSKRLAFRAGPFNEMSLDTFVAILKTSYSFFTLLNKTN